MRASWATAAPTPANWATAVSGSGATSGVVAVAGGYDVVGQLGDGGANADRSTPVAVSGLGTGSGVVAVAGGASHSLAATTAVEPPPVIPEAPTGLMLPVAATGILGAGAFVRRRRMTGQPS